MSARAILQALVALSAEVPDASADPVDVLERGYQVSAARAPLFAQLRSLPLAVEDEPLVDVLTHLGASWEAALTRAHHAVGERVRALPHRRPR